MSWPPNTIHTFVQRVCVCVCVCVCIDVDHHPDCRFASFNHASLQQREPTWDLIMDTRRKCRNLLRRKPPDDFFPEGWTKRCDECASFKPGLVTTKRREGDAHTIRGLETYINSALIALQFRQIIITQRHIIVYLIINIWYNFINT